jgi:hypothetical protein
MIRERRLVAGRSLTDRNRDGGLSGFAEELDHSANPKAF